MIEPRFDSVNNIAEFDVEGTIRKDEYRSSIDFLQNILNEQKGKVKLLKVVKNPGMVNPSIFLGDHVITGLKQINRISTAAVVVDKKWAGKFADIVARALPYKVKVFDIEHLADAKQWLVEQDVRAEKTEAH